MSKRLMELRDQRGKAIADARAILDKVAGEKRALTTDEQEQYDKFIAESTSIKETLDREERAQALELELADGIPAKNAPSDSTTEARMAAFRSFLLGGHTALSADEKRALSAGSSTAGGFLAAPEQFVAQLIAFVKDRVFVRQMATVIPATSAVSLGFPSLDTDVDDGTWTAEVASVTEDTGLAFGKRKLEPHIVSKLVKISNELMRVSSLSPEAIVLDRLGYKFAITEEKAFLTGNGAQQPLGLFTASADGIPTTRDIVGTGATKNTTTAIGFDGLIAAKYALKAQYQDKAVWLFHRDAVAQIATLKDSYGRYLWMPSVIAGQPDTILGRPVYMSEYVPNTFTAGKYVGLFGDLSHYWIADAYDMQIQRLNELYAPNNQIGVIARKNTDAMPVLAEAFARVTLAP